jgi:hypothetical protein
MRRQKREVQQRGNSRQQNPELTAIIVLREQAGSAAFLDT